METSAALPTSTGPTNSDNLQYGFSLNEFDVFPASGEVTTANTVQSLEPKVMQVLVELASCNGEVITAEHLFSQVWPRSVYSPVSVRRAINQLRKVFADDNKTLFKTYPKRGYALHASLTPLAGTQRTTTADNIAKRQWQHRNTAANFTAATPVEKRLHVNRRGLGYLLLLMLAISCSLLLFNAPPALQTAGWQVGALQPLTASHEQETFSRFTPDNKAVVYLTQPDTGSGGSTLWLMSTDRQQKRQLYHSAQHIDFFSWLPSSSTGPRLLLAARQDNTVQFFSLTLSADYQLTAFQEHLRIPHARLNSPFYSDGQSVFYLATEHNTQKLYRADLSTGQIDLLLSASQQFSPYRIAPAATAEAITLLGFDAQQRSQLKLLALGSGEISDIATLDANWYFIDYQPAFAGYLLSDGKALFTLDATQQLQKLPFENYAFLHYPTLAPDGAALSYTHASASGNIYQQPLTAQAPQPLTHGTAHSWQGSFSPDHSQLAYVSNKYGHSQIFVLQLATGQERLVYDNAQQQLALSQPLWSPDGSKLAFARNQRLVIQHLSTAKSEHFDRVIGLPTQWLDNNDELLLTQSAKPVNRWYRFTLSSNRQQAIIASEQAQVIHNDRRYALTASQLQTETGQTLFTAPDGQQISRHFAKQHGLYLVLRAPDTAEPAKIDIWFYNYASASTDKLTSLTLAATEISDISPQQLLYSTFATSKDIHTVSLQRQ